MATDEPSELLPCAICARTFKPDSLEKHTRICEASALKKRKPFDSAKQRIQGTELAEFLPKETIKKKHSDVTTDRGSWKQTHDEFLRTIRAARGVTMEVSRDRQPNPPSNVILGAPTRPNEKGMCPTCNRQFSIKSYERHVAWCKEKATRVPLSAATNIAKERLEARMRYRAPALKNRRAANREKYSPVSNLNFTNIKNNNNNNNNNNATNRSKETASTPNCNKPRNEISNGSQTQKSTVRRSSQSREGASSGPMKSRLSDRSNRLSDEIEPGVTSSSNPTPRCPSPRKNFQKSNYSRIPRKSPPRTANLLMRKENDENSEKIPENKKSSEAKNRRYRQNFVHARSRGNPRINDVTINNEVSGMTVEACDTRKAFEDDELVTWKKIGEKQTKEFLKLKSVENCRKEFTEFENEDKSKNDKIFNEEEENCDLENISWINRIKKLDQTYLIRESCEGENDLMELFGNENKNKKRRPVIDSPRIEFYYDQKSKEKFFFGGTDNDENKVHPNRDKNKSISEIPKLDVVNFENGNENSQNIKNSRSTKNQSSPETENCQIPEFSVRSKSTNTSHEKLTKNIDSGSTVGEKEFSNDSFDIPKRKVEEESLTRSFDVDIKVDEENFDIPLQELQEKMLTRSFDIDETIEEVEEYRNKEFSNHELISEKISKIQSSIENLNLNVNEKKSENSSSENIHHVDPKIKNSCSKQKENYKLIDQSPKLEKSVERINEKSENFQETENPTQSKEDKIDYRRSGTFVIEGEKAKMSFDSKHRFPDEISNETPSKRRKTEKEISLNEENEKTKIIDTKNSINNSEFINSESRLEKNFEFSEKYLNRTFDYDSDETATTENFFQDFEADDSETKKKSTMNIKSTNCQKSFSDSHVRFPSSSISNNNALPLLRPGATNSASEFKDRRNFSEQEVPEVLNTRETRPRSRERLPTLTEKPEVQNSIHMRRKLREKMNLLRGTTNNLVKSIEVTGYGNNENSNAAGSFEADSIQEIEEETIHELDFGKIGKALDTKVSYCGFLPEIPIDRIIGRNGDKRLIARETSPFSWQRAKKSLNARLINLDPPKFHEDATPRRIFNDANLPPVVSVGKKKWRTPDRNSRGVWSDYVRRHPDFNLVLTSRTGSCPADYDPFLLAERQMKELLSDSEKSFTDSSVANRRSTSPALPNYPLSHSSAFVKYSDTKSGKNPDKRVSVIDPPTEFDDFSSDSTETNSITREIMNAKEPSTRSRGHVLGRRVIIDKSRALMGTHNDSSSIHSLFENAPSYNGKVRKLFEKTSPKVERSNSIKVGQNNEKKNVSGTGNKNSQNNRKNYSTMLSGSNVSLNSIVSTDIDAERSIFDELPSSCDDEVVSTIYPSLRSLLKNDSLSVTSPVQSNRSRNGIVSDEEFSSPDSYKRQQEQNKLSADSAYSSLNRKYSNHGRTNDVAGGRQDEDSPLHRRDLDSVTSNARSKMSKFCHECGSKFPDSAKFCCECGIRRLAL